MCEKTIKRVKKGSQKTRLREARRLQRLQSLHQLSTPSPEPTPPCPQKSPDSAEPNWALIDLAYKTMALVQKNKLMQEKIDSLKKKTSEFVAEIMNDPVSRQRYLHNLRLYGSQVLQAQRNIRETNILTLPIMLEPKVCE